MNRPSQTEIFNIQKIDARKTSFLHLAMENGAPTESSAPQEAKSSNYILSASRIALQKVEIQAGLVWTDTSK